MFGAGAAAGVLGDEPAQPVQGAARAGDGAAHAVELAQLAGGDPDQATRSSVSQSPST